MEIVPNNKWQTLFLRKDWWKYLAIVLVTYALIGGMLFPIPNMDIVDHTARNLHYHVPMWFGMVLLLFAGLVSSVAYLRTFDLRYDALTSALNSVGIVYGLLGLTTGMVWANYTWGEPWSNDPKQASAAIAMLMYFAYFILRGSIDDEDKSGKVSAVYNIIIFFVYIALIFIIPRLTESLHPGSGGNPAFSSEDQDNRLKMVFYPAVIGFTLLGFWMASIRLRIQYLAEGWKIK